MSSNSKPTRWSDALSSAASAAGQGTKPPADAEREALRERDGRPQT